MICYEIFKIWDFIMKTDKKQNKSVHKLKDTVKIHKVRLDAEYIKKTWHEYAKKYEKELKYLEDK